MEKRQLNRLYPLLVAAGLMAALLACIVPPPPGGVKFDVQRQSSVVRTGSSASLSELTDNAFHSLPDGYLVTTDTSGEALLQGTLAGGTCRVYLFNDSGLAKRACAKSSYTGGNTSCVEEGSAVFRDCSTHIAMTPSGEAQVTGSWLWVVYLPGWQLTLFVLSEGQATVRPVLALENRELGGDIVLSAQQFLYTAPNAVLRTIGDLPPRRSLPLYQLPPLIKELGIERWLERARTQARVDKVPFLDFSTPTPTLELQPCAPGVLYCENFDDGQAEGWDLDPGWKVGREGANYVLAGSEHYWATLTGQEWDDYRLRLRLKLLGGSIHLNYHLTEGPIRYFIGFHQDGLYLSRQIRDAFTDLAAVEVPHALNRWYQVEIVGWGGHLQVYVDGKLELDYTDRAPLPRGTIAFETLEGSQALVDGIEVLPPGPEPARLTPTPTRTPTRVSTPTRTPTRRPTSTPTAIPDTTGPAISNVTASTSRIGWPPPYCSPNEVTISATVRDVAGISGVKLTYRVVDGTRQGSWQALEMKQRATDTYAGTIGDAELKASLNPPVQLTATLEYYVQAFDGRGNRSQSSTGTVKVEYCIY